MSRLSIACAVVLTSLTVEVGLAVAQPTEPQTGVLQEVEPGLLRGAPVVGAPFAAEAVVTWHPPGDPAQHFILRYFRDREGRVRVEQLAGDGAPVRVTVASDPGAPTVQVVDAAAGTVAAMPRGLAASAAGGGLSVVVASAADRVLAFHSAQAYQAYSESAVHACPETSTVPPIAPASGEPSRRSFQGLEVVATRLCTTLPADAFGGRGPVDLASERWVAPALGLLLYTRIEDTLLGTVEYRVSRLSLADPPASLFLVPHGHAHTAMATRMAFENPRLPAAERARLNATRR